MNTSSVHLRDLDNLVSAFPSNGDLGSHYTKDSSHSTRLHVVDESSCEEARTRSHTTTFSSKICCPPISPLQSRSIFDQSQHRISAKSNLLASEKELNALLPFGEQRSFNGTELGLLDSLSVTETDLSETQNRKNSLHLISELCDRLAASDSAEKGKHNKATQTAMVDTPNDSASQRLNLNSQTYFSYATPHSQTNTAVSTALVERPHESYPGTQSDYNDATENGYDDFLTQCHEPCGTCCEPGGAVSCLEHLIERISPPLSCTTPVNELDIQSSNGLTNSSSGR